jgi:hypothetical protein
VYQNFWKNVVIDQYFKFLREFLKKMAILIRDFKKKGKNRPKYEIYASLYEAVRNAG